MGTRFDYIKVLKDFDARHAIRTEYIRKRDADLKLFVEEWQRRQNLPRDARLEQISAQAPIEIGQWHPDLKGDQVEKSPIQVAREEKFDAIEQQQSRMKIQLEKAESTQEKARYETKREERKRIKEQKAEEYREAEQDQAKKIKQDEIEDRLKDQIQQISQAPAEPVESALPLIQDKSEADHLLDVNIEADLRSSGQQQIGQVEPQQVKPIENPSVVDSVLANSKISVSPSLPGVLQESPLLEQSLLPPSPDQISTQPSKAAKPLKNKAFLAALNTTISMNQGGMMQRAPTRPKKAPITPLDSAQEASLIHYTKNRARLPNRKRPLPMTPRQRLM